MKHRYSFAGLFIVVLCLFASPAYAQLASRVQAVGRAQQRQIMIRWGVNNASAWKISNQYGFEVSRYTVIRDQVMLAKPERKDLGVFKPAPLEQWRTPVEQNEYAAIIAQALYGETFDVSGAGESGILATVNKAQEAEQRFVLSLYAADRNFDAAVLAGWGLVDTDVKPNEKYLYRIVPAAPPKKLPIDSAAVFIGLADYKPLPAVADIHALFNDRIAVVDWDYAKLKDYYNAYIIERSSDGNNFYSVTPRPIMNMNGDARIRYADTLGLYDVKYYYRVAGVTPFGETGPPSTVVSGVGHQPLTHVPHILRAILRDDGGMLLEWEFEATANTLLAGFTLNQSETEKGPYVPVVKNIDPQKRGIVYDKLFPTNYFTLTATTPSGESQTSMPVLVQPLDSLPPAAPQGLRVVVDSAGVVRLSWQANTEKDLGGYKVFRSYSRNAELTPLTDSVVYTNTFTDTVSMRLMNRKLFYSITALDKRYNQSAFSPLTLAMKPDVVKPSAPVFTKYEVVDHTVRLRWADSHDSDVASHALYARADAETKWRLIRQFGPKTPGEYVDTEAQRGHRYAYTLISKDSSGLESDPASPIQLKVAGDPDDITVSQFNAYVDRDKHYVELFWRDAVKNVEEYQLYKQKKGGPVTLWKIVKGTEKRLADEDLSINTEYTYGIRIVTAGGQMSRMKWVVVNY